MQRSFWSNWFKPATGSSRSWTLEELGELYEVLLRNGVVTEHNRATVVETIRTIAEYILWGDQNEPRIFDFFLENNILTYLHKVLLQPSNRSGEVAKQVLQTLSIIIQNVRSETGIFFLFSNNHINNIVDLDFDFSDEEVLGYYISFLKTISLKLNAGTVHFFLNSSSTGRGFPLYTRAIRLAHNREGMVRAAVRTLTLNVYSVNDPDIHNYITSPPASNYFTEVAHYLAEQVQLLDRQLSAAEAGGSQALSSLDSQLAETEDVLSYASDLLSLGVPRLSQLLAKSLWQWVLRPLLLRPLMQPGAATNATMPLLGTSSLNSSSSRVATPTASGMGSPAGVGHFKHFSWGSGSWTPDAAAKQSAAARVRPVCSVFVLERFFLLVSYQPLLEQLLLALACGATAPSSHSSTSGSNHPLADTAAAAATYSSSNSSADSSSCRACLMGMLSSTQPFPALLVVRLLVAVVNNRHLPAELLAALSILPRKQQHSAQQSCSSLDALVQSLLQQLQVASGAAAAGDLANSSGQQLANGQRGGPGTPTSTAAAAASAHRSQQQDRLQVDLLMLLTEQYLHAQYGADQAAGAAAAAAAGGSSDGSSDSSSTNRRAAERLQLLDQWAMSQQQQQQQQQQIIRCEVGPDQPESSAYSSFGPQLLSNLLLLLQLPGLPPLGLWLLGWLLHQLLPVSSVAGATAGGSAFPADGAAIAASHHNARGMHDAVIDRYVDDARGSRGISRSTSSSSSADSNGSSNGDSNSSNGRHNKHQRGSSAGGDELQQPGSSSSRPDAAAFAAGPPVSTTRAASVQSSFGPEPLASVLSSPQQEQLQQALDASRAGFAQQLSGMWCEAVFPLLALEWPAAREMLLRPVLRAGSSALLSGTAAWPVLQALQQQQQQSWQQQQQRQQQPRQQQQQQEAQSSSAQAALNCYYAVQRVVALTQIQELLRVGYVASSPPVPTVSEADLKQVDIQEGYQVDLAPGSALTCVVSFAPGQERRVYFAVAGLSKQQLAALQGPQPSSSPAAANHHHSSSPGSAAAAAASQASLLRSLPVGVLADPSPSRPQAGVVLSVAPLLGAHPYADPQVGKWLHVHVRPSVRGLLRIIKTAGAKKGGVLAAMRQLADGHWVLAFGSADKAALAVTMVQQHATRLQGLYREALAPLCQDAPQQLHQTGQPDQQPNTQQQQQHNRLLQADCEKDAAAAAGAQQSDADEQHLQAEGLAGDMARASLGGSVGQ